jgi:transposase-like protein
MPCEDYPCCGHDPGDCPRVDSKGRERWKCVECGKELSLKATSSICSKCLSKLRRRWSDPEFDIDHDHSMDY